MTAMSVVWRLAFATSLIVLAFAMAAPVLAIILQQAGHGTTTVGAFAMIPFLMVAVLIPVVPRVLARWGIVRAYRWGCVLQLAAILGYALGDGLAVWSIAAVSGGAIRISLAERASRARCASPSQRKRPSARITSNT